MPEHRHVYRRLHTPHVIAAVGTAIPSLPAAIYAAATYWASDTTYVPDLKINSTDELLRLDPEIASRSDSLLNSAYRLSFSPRVHWKDPFSSGTCLCYWSAALTLLFLPRIMHYKYMPEQVAVSGLLLLVLAGGSLGFHADGSMKGWRYWADMCTGTAGFKHSSLSSAHRDDRHSAAHAPFDPQTWQIQSTSTSSTLWSTRP